MEALEKRVTDRMMVEKRQLQAEQMSLGKRRKKLIADAGKAQGVTAKLFESLEQGTVPTKLASDAAAKAFRTTKDAARQITLINAQMSEKAAALAKLADPAERTRRVKVAKALGVTDEPVTGVQAIEMVLVRRGKATHITDLTSDVLESGVVKLTGKTPSQTISAYAAKEVAKPDGRFVRVAPGVFDLRARQAAKEPATA